MQYVYSYFHFLAAILFLILGVVLLVRDSRSRLHQTCAGILFCFFFWSFGTTWVHHPATPVKTARCFGRLASFGWIFFSTFHVWFAWLYTRRKPFRFMKPVIAISLLFPAVLTYLQWTQSIFLEAFERRPYGWFTPWSPTPWPAIYFAYLTIMTLGAFWLIFDYGRKSDNRFIRMQSVIIISSGLISLLSGFLINIYISIYYPEGLPPVGDVTLLVWALGLTYVAIKYNILNITPFIAANRIISTMKDLLFLLDTHGFVISVNRAAEQVLACRNDRITGRHFSELIAGKERQRARIPTIMITQSEYNVETILSCTPGTAIPVELSTSLIPGIGVVCVAHNITLQKQRTESLKEAKKHLESRVSQATKELRQINDKLVREVEEKNQVVDALLESEERFRIIFEYAPDGICLIDRYGNFVTGNNEALRILGFRKNELAGNNLMDAGLLSRREAGEVLEMIAGNAGEGVSGYREFVLQRSDRSELPVEISVHRLNISEKMLGVCIIRDMSQRKAAEKEAQELRTALHHSQKMDAVGRLAGGIAHDFNNLLGGIIGYAGLLQKRLHTEFPAETEVLEKIIAVSKQAADRTAQLLAFARKGKYNVQSIDMHTVIDEVINLMRHTIDPKILLTCHHNASDATVNGDRSQLHSALLNLGVNARDALPGGGHITFSTENVSGAGVDFSEMVEGPVADRYLKIVVSDDGTGMDEETVSRIFEPFFSTKEEGKGTGLGLPSVYGTVTQHGGYIHCTSVVHNGTDFIVYLPVIGMNVPCEEVCTDTVAGSHHHEGMILIVDDTELIREMMEEALIDAGYSVHTCEDGTSALQWYREQYASCDLVILDYTMPDINGKECYEAMKEIYPPVKAVISSGHAVDGEIGKSIDAGVMSFLQKPFEVDDLIALVENILSEG